MKSLQSNQNLNAIPKMSARRALTSLIFIIQEKHGAEQSTITAGLMARNILPFSKEKKKKQQPFIQRDSENQTTGNNARCLPVLTLQHVTLIMRQRTAWACCFLPAKSHSVLSCYVSLTHTFRFFVFLSHSTTTSSFSLSPPGPGRTGQR